MINGNRMVSPRVQSEDLLALISKNPTYLQAKTSDINKWAHLQICMCVCMYSERHRWIGCRFDWFANECTRCMINVTFTHTLSYKCLCVVTRSVIMANWYGFLILFGKISKMLNRCLGMSNENFDVICSFAFNSVTVVTKSGH